MKRARIILAGVALFAVVGGALAVKASKAPKIIRTLYTTNAAGQCRVTVFTSLTTVQQFPNQPISTITNLYSTAPTTLPCPLTTWYSIE